MAIVCFVRRCGLVVVLPSMQPLHVICALLSVMPFGRMGKSPCLDIMAIVLRCACPSFKCHSWSICLAVLVLRRAPLGAVELRSVGVLIRAFVEYWSVFRVAFWGLFDGGARFVDVGVLFFDIVLCVLAWMRVPLFAPLRLHGCDRASLAVAGLACEMRYCPCRYCAVSLAGSSGVGLCSTALVLAEFYISILGEIVNWHEDFCDLRRVYCGQCDGFTLRLQCDGAGVCYLGAMARCCLC